MSFQARELRSLGSIGQGGMWTYRTMDDVTVANYFSGAVHLLGLGDIIAVTVLTGMHTPDEAWAGSESYYVVDSLATLQASGSGSGGGGAAATEAFTASDTLTTAESGKHCTNDGAVIPVTLTAPASPVINDEYTLERVAGYAFRFKPGAGHTVNGGTADKYVELTAAGVLTFKYLRAGAWIITNDSAAWNFEP